MSTRLSYHDPAPIIRELKWRLSAVEMSRVKVILTAFATEGPPHDDGLPIADCLDAYGKTVKESGIDEVILFTPKTLAETLGREVADHCTRKLNPPGLRILHNYHNVGMGTWRAIILEHVVDTHSDGDIVIFHDPNWKKCPGILNVFAPNARDYATAAISVASRSKIFSPPHMHLGHTVTKDTFYRIAEPGITAPFHAPCAKARCIVLEINAETRKFVQRFVDACALDENLVGGEEASTRLGGWPISGFIHNAGDQAVFNSLVYGTGLWDLQKDDWIIALGEMGGDDSGTHRLLDWASRNRGWRSDK